MLPFKKIIILSVCILQIYGKGFNMMSTRIIQDSLTVEGNNVAEYVTMTVKMYNGGTRDAYFNVEANIVKRLPDEVFLVFKVEKLNPNKKVYEPMPFGIEKNYCRYMQMDKLVYPLLLKKGTFPSKCPVLPGVYKLTNYTASSEDIPVAVPLGTYRVTFAFRYQSQAITLIWMGHVIQD